jgi:hypothetical protein
MQVLQDHVQRQEYIVLSHDDEFVPWVHREGITKNVSHHHKVLS